MSRLASISLAGLLVAGCAHLGVVGDGTSVSWGHANLGYLLDGAVLPPSGEGFTTSDRWQRRGLRTGTDELISLVAAVAKRVQHAAPGVRLVIADLSRPGGGSGKPYHRSHQSGRDADLLPFMLDASGRSVEADAMHLFDEAGLATDASGLQLDVPRTWLLVRTLVTSPEARVQYVFFNEALALLLLDHARAAGEPAAIVERARAALLQPGASPHNDHLHLRIFCTDADTASGCVDFGNMQLDDKEPAALAGVPTALRQLLVAAAVWLPVMLGDVGA